MRFGNFFKNPLGIAVKIIIKIYPFIICPISSCHGSRRVKRLFDFTTFLPACELACQYSLYSCGGTLPNRVRTERIIVTSHCHGGKISGSQQSALTELTAGRNVWGTVLFLSAILHRKVIHVKYFRFFFSAILAGLRLLLRSRNFATPKQPHHPTTTTHTLHAAVCIPRSRKIWYQSAYSPKRPLCICCCTKDERSAYSNRYSSHSQCLLSITVVFLFILGMFLRK